MTAGRFQPQQHLEMERGDSASVRLQEWADLELHERAELGVLRAMNASTRGEKNPRQQIFVSQITN